MSKSYKDVKGYLFIEAKELESVYKAPYSVLFILCIAASYIFLLPPALLSTGCALAVGWVGVGWLVKKYLLQDKLISKGDIGGFV